MSFIDSVFTPSTYNIDQDDLFTSTKQSIIERFKESSEESVYIPLKLKGYTDIKIDYESDVNKIIEIAFFGSLKPWLNLKIKNLINKSSEKPLSQNEMIYLIRELAKVSIDFYNIKKGKYVAFDLEGRIVENADTEMNLISKVQERNFKKQIFLWHVGYDTFSGWNT